MTLGKCFPSVTQFPICTVKGLEGVALQGGITPPLLPSSSVVSKSNIEMQCRGATLSLVESEDRVHEQCREDSSSKKGKDAKEIINPYNQNPRVWQQLNLEFRVKLALVCEATESSSALL